MAFVAPKDRVFEQSTSNSQSVFMVTGALDAGYNAFSSSMSVGDTTFGAVVEPGVAFKTGLLTYSATNEVTVSVVFESSSMNSLTYGYIEYILLHAYRHEYWALKKVNIPTDNQES